MYTSSTEKIKYSKPIFKLKTTTAPPATDKYVLVHTISQSQEDNKIEEESTRKPTTSDSIQSIILMLNGTNPGPEYEVTGGGNFYTPDSTPAYSNFQSTASMENNYSPFITTNGPQRPTTLNVPSTSYIYSPYPITRRPATKNPSKTPTTLNVPHTSYIYSPTPSKRPTIGTSSVQPNKKFTTIPTKSTQKYGTTQKIAALDIQQHQQQQQSGYDGQPIKVDDNYVILTGGGMTKHPSPTVHITPKPINNVNNKVTQSIQTRLPVTITTHTTQRPSYSSTVQYAPSASYGPHIQDFQDEGYFGGLGTSTIRPIEHTVTSTTYYAVVDNNSGINPGLSTLGPHQRPSATHPIVVNKIQLDDGSQKVPPMQDQTVMTVDELSNFPPVRNPNLNMTGVQTQEMNPEEIATPAFVEDAALDEKMSLLVSKIVASLQGNFDNLVDIVYERKNVSTAEHDISNLQQDETKLTTTTKKPTANKVTKPAKAPTKATQKPVKVTAKPTPKPAKATTKPPARPANTGRPSAAPTTKKPAKAPTTTRRPATKRTTPRPQGK